MQHFKHILFMLFCVLLTQCFESSFQQTDNKIKVLRALSSEIIMARYESFTGKSEDLSQECPLTGRSVSPTSEAPRQGSPHSSLLKS